MTSEYESESVRRAAQFCERAHQGQKRDDGRDYATHPQAVADILRRHGVTDEATLAAAYLHDVIEDTATDEATLEREFGNEVAELVRELTNIGPRGRSFAEKQATLLAHARKMSAKARLVKMADRLHNLSEMHAWPAWKQARYARAGIELLEALRASPDESLAEELRTAAAAIIARHASEKSDSD